MTSLFYYISSWLYTEENTSCIPDSPPFNNQIIPESKNTLKYLVSADDLLGVKLKSVDSIVPSPARNMPNISKFNLQMLNKAQLNAILSVKLKPVKPQKKKTYLPRHPVLRELLSKKLNIY
jgi:hypothetical protein